MKPSEIIKIHQAQIQSLIEYAKSIGITEFKVFGSIVRGEDTEQSDVDLLVSANPGYSLFKLLGLVERFQDLLGVKVDIVVESEVPNYMQHIKDEAHDLINVIVSQK